MISTDFACGPWTGFYNYKAGGQRHRMDLALTFVRGIVAGQGSDKIGVFGIAGCYNRAEGEILWTKTYYGAHCVRYHGFADGCTIWGTWEIDGAAKGGFHIWPLGHDVRHEFNQNAKKETAPLRLPARKMLR